MSHVFLGFSRFSRFFLSFFSFLGNIVLFLFRIGVYQGLCAKAYVLQVFLPGFDCAESDIVLFFVPPRVFREEEHWECWVGFGD